MLTPEQIQAYRTQYKIKPTNPSAPIQQDPQQRIAALKSGTFASPQAVQPKVVTGETNPDGTPKPRGGLISSEVESGHDLYAAANAGMAADVVAGNEKQHADLIQKLSQKSQEMKAKGEDSSYVDKTLKQFLAEQAGGTVPGTDLGAIVPETNKTDEQVLGDFLGIGADVLTAGGKLNAVTGGASFGATHAMQENKSATGVVKEAVTDALIAKLLEVGFNVASPYVQKALTKYGKPLYSEIAKYIPAGSREAMQKFADEASIKTGNEALDASTEGAFSKLNKATNAPFNSLDKKIEARGKRVVSPNKDFDKSVREADEIINPDRMQTEEDRARLLGSDAEEVGTGPFKRERLKTEVMAKEGTNETARELAQQGKISTKNRASKNVAAVEGELQNEGNNLTNFLKEPRNNVQVKYSDIENNVNRDFKQFKIDNSISEGSAEERAAQKIKDKYLDEIVKSYKSQHISEAGNATGAKKGIENFNKRMKDELGDSIFSNTPEGKTQVKMAKMLRKNGYDTIKETIDTASKARTLKVIKPSDTTKLFDEAKNWDSPEGFQKYVKKNMPEYSSVDNFASGSKRNFQEGMNTKNQYATSVDQDLEEIWHNAHTGINSTAGDAFKASIERQAKLYGLRDEMKFRNNSSVGKTAVEKFLASKKGRALQQTLRYAGFGVAASATGGTLYALNKD